MERRIHPARFPATNSIPGLNKVLELARCDDILRRKNIIALGNSGTGLLHLRPAGLESDDRW